MFRNNNYATIHIPRLLALTIPFLIVTIAHGANALGIWVYPLLLEPTFDLGLLLSGLLVAMIGLKLGLFYLILLLFIVWVLVGYVYMAYVAGIL